MEDNNEFYNFIVGISGQINYEVLLKKDSQIILDVITKDYKKNVHLAASRGANKAYICIYEIGTKYKGVIPIDAFVRMNNEMINEKFQYFGLETIIDRLRIVLFPFKVEIKNLTEVELRNDLEVTDSTIDSIIRSRDIPDITEIAEPQSQSNSTNLIGIMVSWEKKTKK